MAGRACRRDIRQAVSGEELYRIMESSLTVRWEEYTALWAMERGRSPFAVLVAIILSQNTNDRNSIEAFESLRRSIRLSPRAVLEAPVESLEGAIRAAGQWRQKAGTIRRLAEALLEAGGEDYLEREDPETLRRFLLGIKGIGPKTADVFLSLYRKAPYFAVDTHAARIARRWCIAGGRSSYDSVSRAFLEYFGRERAEPAHRLLIALGRSYCIARDPRCPSCPVREHCPSARLG